MSAFVASSLLMLLTVFAMENSPKVRLNMEHAISALQRFPQPSSFAQRTWSRWLHGIMALLLESERRIKYAIPARLEGWHIFFTFREEVMGGLARVKPFALGVNIILRAFGLTNASSSASAKTQSRMIHYLKLLLYLQLIHKISGLTLILASFNVQVGFQPFLDFVKVQDFIAFSAVFIAIFA
jgi:hypothetical protein